LLAPTTPKPLMLSPLMFHRWTFDISGWVISILPLFLIYFLDFTFLVLIKT
jgi:hypothetical protein